MEKIYGDHMNLLTIPGEAFFHPQFFNEEDSYLFFDKLTEEIEWKRQTAFYGDEHIGYSHSGTTVYAKPWTEVLLKIKTQIEQQFEVQFNSCLLHYYRDGKDGRGWRRDNEKSLGRYPVIASVSFGASRIFQFRNYKDKLPIISIALTHGSLLMMKAETQEYWEHRLPKTTLVTQPRINLEFRLIHS